MNVSLQDGYNIGWKLAHVLSGRSAPSLLQTYDEERRKVAAELIEFDRWLIKLWTLEREGAKDEESEKELASQFSEGFKKSARYTAGLTSKYEDSCVVRGQRSCQTLAEGLVVGMRFPSAQVVRFCDAKAMQLMQAFKADGRWRVVVFAGDITLEAEARKLRDVSSSRNILTCGILTTPCLSTVRLLLIISHRPNPYFHTSLCRHRQHH